MIFLQFLSKIQVRIIHIYLCRWVTVRVLCITYQMVLLTSFFKFLSKWKKKCFACVRLSLEAGWSLISLWRIYDHVMKFDQSESPSSQQGIDAPCNYQRGKREENDGGGGAWSARYSLDIFTTRYRKALILQYSIIETTHLISTMIFVT